jgi:hydroxyacylglutathione hydrolase
MKMKIKTFTLGQFQSNCYIVYHDQEAIVIDPGYESDEVIHFIIENKLKLLAIYATHGHVDHVGGIKQLKELFNPIVYAPLKDKIWTINSIYNHVGHEIPVDQYIEEGFELYLGDYRFYVISTPGHSEGGTILYNEKEHICFSGDTIFYQTIGRTDLPFSNFSSIKTSIEKMYEILPDQTILYPGHGRTTTIAFEKKYNMFVRDKKQA